MKPKLHGIAGVLVLGTLMCVGKSQDAATLQIPQLRETPEQREARMQWFRDAKFGMFVHWGPAAISGEEISWGMAGRIEGGQQHMKVPRETYMNLYRQFNPVKFDPDEWLRLAKAAGMKYIVFITKHHDGFSMWPTKQVRFGEGSGFAPRYSIADTPYQKDICRMIQQAAKTHGLITLIKLTLDRAVSEIQSGPAVITKIVPDPDGTIVLRPDAAETTGGVKAERRLDVPNLGYWTNPKGAVWWPIDITSPGRYTVQAETASPYSGVRLTVAVGNRTVTGEAPNTGSHDSYVNVALGTMEFPNVEKVVVRVTAAEPERWRPINLRNVKLIPKP